MKKHLEISSFYISVPKITIRWCTVPEIWCATDGQTDRWKKWHIEVGAPPKKHASFILYIKFWEGTFVKCYDTATSSFISGCLTSVFISTDIIFYNFLELCSALADKRFSSQIFLCPSPHPFDVQNLLSMTKNFCQFFLIKFINWFSLLSKTPHTQAIPFLHRQYQAEWNTNQNRVGIEGSRFMNHISISWSHKPKFH